MIRQTLVILLALFSPSLVFAQRSANRQPPERPDPTVADFVYGQDSERQKFDFWQAKSDQPTPLVLLIHGGGWQGGDKTGYGTSSIQPFLDAGVSVASINYRYIRQAMEQAVEPPVKACLLDAGAANSPRQGQGMESRSPARGGDRRLGRGLHLAVAGAAR